MYIYIYRSIQHLGMLYVPLAFLPGKSLERGTISVNKVWVESCTARFRSNQIARDSYRSVPVDCCARVHCCRDGSLEVNRRLLALTQYTVRSATGAQS